MSIPKVGTGWKKLSNAVYEKGEIRVHIGAGLVKHVKEFGIFMNHAEIHRAMRITGGNRKRAMMLIGNKELEAANNG